MAEVDTRERSASPSGGGAPPPASSGLVWVRRGSALLLLLVGWGFILATHHFHLTASSLFIGLGYTAAVAAVYTLFRTGATAVATTAEDLGAAEWGAPMGPRGELEREKRMLLKAIREAEFDHEMGKLSKADADLMIAQYRARAIAIIKQLDTVDGETASTRSSIEREVRARLELGGPKTKGKKAKGKPAAPAASELAASKTENKQSVAALDPEDAASEEDAGDDGDASSEAPAHEFSDSTAAPDAATESAVEAQPAVNGTPKPAASNPSSVSKTSGKSGKGGKKAAKKESA